MDRLDVETKCELAVEKRALAVEKREVPVEKREVPVEKRGLTLEKREMDPKIQDSILRLQDKFTEAGQNLGCYLDGLLYAGYQKYWEYIRLDTLLSIQTPRTEFKDEMVFILYHQISELYFRLILWELEQITGEQPVEPEVFLNKLERINRYYKHLIQSFDIMSEGLDQAQFMKFRNALAPASGFQSIQYRIIELHATDLRNLVAAAGRADVSGRESLEKLFEKIYWREGSVDAVTGRKDLSLLHFEKKYNAFLLGLARQHRDTNIWQQFKRHYQCVPFTGQIVRALRTFDTVANVEWPLMHYRSAVKHLHRGKEAVAATGGTNWKKYLPPRYQKVIFFPGLWTEEEAAEWGRIPHWELA